MAKLAGIYTIMCMPTMKSYIGSSVNIGTRFCQHKRLLYRNKHPNIYLQNSWNKYGESLFEFHVIEYCPKENLIGREQFYLDIFKPTDLRFGFNINPTADSNYGRKFGIIARNNNRNAQLGRKHSEETKKKISAIWLGKKRPIATREKMSKARQGIKLSEETKKKLSIINTGKKLSEECKQKMSKNLKGHKGAIHTQEFKNKIAILTGIRMRKRFINPEEREKQSKSTTIWWAKRKNNICEVISA